MRRRSVAAVVVATSLWLGPAFGADTLEPVGAAAERHELALTGPLQGLFDNGVLARVIVERSGSPLMAIGVDQLGDAYRIFSIDVAGAEWTAIEDKKPAAKRCELQITPELAQAIVGVWKTMLQSTQSQLDTSDIDGATYTFSATIAGQLRLGLTADPLPSSPPGEMVSLALAMRDACHTKGATGLTRIPGLVSSLQSRTATKP